MGSKLNYNEKNIMLKIEENIEDLPNIGSFLAKELKGVGIVSYEKLKQTGSAKALFMIKGKSGAGCMNMLYALEGAIKKTRWHNLTIEERENVKQQFLSLIKECN